MIRTSKIREISSDDTDSEATYEATEPELEPETSSEQAVEVILVPGQAQGVHPDLERLMGLMFICGNSYPFGHHPNCPIGHTAGDLSISQAEAGDEASAEPEPETDPTLYEIPAIVINLTTFKKTKHISALDKQLKRLRNKDNITKVIWHRQWSLRPGQRFKRNDQNESKILLMLINHYNRIADELRRRQITDLHINEYDALREVDQGSGTGDMLWQDQFAMLMDKTQGTYLEKLSTSYGSSETTTRLSIACNTFPRLATAFTDLEKAPASDDASKMAGINFEKLQIYVGWCCEVASSKITL